jgi:hypothetical protein
MLTASVTTYFSVLDLATGGALVKFVAQYRALRDVRALNEIISTTFVIFAPSASSPTWWRSGSPVHGAVVPAHAGTDPYRPDVMLIGS